MARLLVLLLLAACATSPLPVVPTPPPTASVPEPPRPLLKVHQRAPSGVTSEWGVLPPAPTHAKPLPEGPWYVTPLAPIRTEAEAEALALAAVLREYQVPGLAFGEVGLPEPTLLARLVEGTRITTLYLMALLLQAPRHPLALSGGLRQHLGLRAIALQFPQPIPLRPHPLLQHPLTTSARMHTWLSPHVHVDADAIAHSPTSVVTSAPPQCR